MRLLVIRHARAVEARPGVPDSERALTREGAARFELTARGLARILDAPTTLLASPMLRARQTAALCSTAWGGIEPRMEPALASGNVDGIFTALANHANDESVVLVGHEPTVSQLVTGLLSAHNEAITFGVGTAALLDLTSVARRAGHLVWFLPAQVTEALGSL